MPEFQFTEDDPERGEYNVTVDFKITATGSPPSYWDPGDPIEIELESASVWKDSAPDAVTVYDNAKAIPAECYERWETRVLEEFDFHDYWAAEAEDYADYLLEQKRDRELD